MPAGQSARARAAELRDEAIQLHAKALKYERDAENWDAGAVGEERVAQVLGGMDRSTTRVLHDRLLKPGSSKVNFDHLVVSPAGAFVIDAKNWTGDATVHEARCGSTGRAQRVGGRPARTTNSRRCWLPLRTSAPRPRCR